MGKGKGKIHDKAYIKASEYSKDGWGGKIAKIENVEQPVPFDHCCLSLEPFKNPVGTDKGYIYELEEIVEWLKEHKIDPCTGEKLSAKDLVKLNFKKNENGNFCCPITGKEFNKFFHIVYIKTSGNVYSYEAVKQLNIDPKNWNDLLTGEPFTKKDIITIQHKEDNRFRLASNFYYLKNKMRFQKVETKETDPTKNVNLSMTNLNIIKKVTESMPKETKKLNDESFRKTDSAAFTSSSYNPSEKKEEPVIEKKTEKKGYVQLITNLGTIDLELHCDLTPNTCLNFLTHCENGYYTGTIFHRSIKNFMVQGGDPEGTGRGGESIWGKCFKDEIVPSLKHDGIGVLSMANRGKDTNGSQFFITYKSAKHLDGKHTVFGRVIDDYETLKKIEAIPTDSSDRPLQEIKILDVDVVFNPLSNEELQKEKKEKEEKERKLKKLEEDRKEKGQWFSNPSGFTSNKSNSSIIGKYINASNINKPKTDKKRTLNFDNVIKTQIKKPKKQYGDFSNW